MLFKLIGRLGPPVKIKVIKCTEKFVALDLFTFIWLGVDWGPF